MQNEVRRRKCPTCWFEWLDKYNKASCPKCHGPMTDGEKHGSRKIHTDAAHVSRFDIRKEPKKVIPRTFRKICDSPSAVIESKSLEEVDGGPLYDGDMPKTPASQRSTRRSVSSIGSNASGAKLRQRKCPTCWFEWFDTHNKAECPKCHAPLPDGVKHGSRKIHTDRAHSRLGNVRREDKKFSPRLSQTMKKTALKSSPYYAQVSLSDSPILPSSPASQTKMKTSSKNQSRSYSFDRPFDFHHVEEESTFQQKVNRKVHHHEAKKNKPKARRRLCPTCWFKWLDVYVISLLSCVLENKRHCTHTHSILISYNKANCPKCHGPMPDGDVEGSRRIHTDEIRHRIGNNRHLDRALQRTRIREQSRKEERKMLEDFEEEEKEEEEKQRKDEENLVARTQASIVDDAVVKMQTGVPPLPESRDNDDGDDGGDDWERRVAEKFNEAKRAELEAQRLRASATAISNSKKSDESNKNRDEKTIRNRSPFVKMSSNESTATSTKSSLRGRTTSSNFSMNLSPELVRADVRKIGTSTGRSGSGPRTRNEIMYDAWKKRHLKEIEKESLDVHNRVFHKKGEDYDREVLEKALLKSGTHRHDTVQWRTDMSWLAHIRPDFQKDHPLLKKKREKKNVKKKSIRKKKSTTNSTTTTMDSHRPQLNDDYNESHHIHTSLDDHADLNRFKAMPSEHDMDVAMMARRYAHGENVLPAQELQQSEEKGPSMKRVVFQKEQELQVPPPPVPMSRVIEDDEKKKRKDAVSEIIRNKYYPQLQSHSLYRNHLNRGRDGAVAQQQQHSHSD